jgi:hypothetical protein
MDAPRFVILHHRDHAGEHWDFMIELPTALATWKLPADPADPDALPLQGTRSHDHRKHYLDYQGPVSGDRGHVTRVDNGRCRIRQAGEAAWEFTLDGHRMNGTFRLERDDPDRPMWMLRRV